MKLSSKEIANIIQLGILVVLLATLGFIGYQLRANALVTRISTSTARVNLFHPLLTAKITQDDIDMMLLHLADRIDVSTYYEHYEGRPDRIKSYLLMERKYIYILYSIDIDERIDHFASGAVKVWLEELCQYYEFRHVHESQRHYYPEFAKLVDSLIGRTKITGWMLDTKEKL